MTGRVPARGGVHYAPPRTAATTAALPHPLLRRAAASADCRREVPISHLLADGALVEGTADLAFREKGGWVVIDFKSDARRGGAAVPFADRGLCRCDPRRYRRAGFRRHPRGL